MFKRLINKFFVRELAGDDFQICQVIDAEIAAVNSEPRVYVTLDVFSEDLLKIKFRKFIPLSWIGETEFYSELSSADEYLNGNTERSDLVKKIADNKAWGIR